MDNKSNRCLTRKLLIAMLLAVMIVSMLPLTSLALSINGEAGGLGSGAGREGGKRLRIVDIV